MAIISPENRTMSLEKLPVSVTMIAHNEAHNLPRSLANLADWVSEIVVVINDCTDATQAVAEKFGAHVYERPWSGRRDQKNVALDLATQPWVLAMDADEVISPELKKEIQDFFESESKQWEGAMFPRQTWFLGRWIRHGDWYPDYNLRLFRRDRARWSGSAEHDKITLSGRMKKLRADLWHYSFPTLETNVTKITHFTAAFAREQRERGKKWSLAHTLIRPVWRFFRGYFLRLGFLDGFPGFYIAVVAAVATFVRYSKVYEVERTEREKVTKDVSRDIWKKIDRW